MQQQGWIILHRQILENPIWNEEPFTRGQAWIDLLLLANHKDNKFFINGNIMTIKRGQFHTSILKLADRWRWSRKKTKHFLDVLIQDNMIAIDVSKGGTSNGTTITIVKYDDFQNVGTTEVATKEQRRNNEGTTKEQRRNINKECIKNDNNENNEKKIYGTFNNVKLTDEEYQKLQERFPDYEQRIENLSEYIASKGKRYSSHYATILSWSRKDKKEDQRKEQTSFFDALDACT